VVARKIYSSDVRRSRAKIDFKNARAVFVFCGSHSNLLGEK